MEYKVPGVYIQEIPSLPPSVASVGTAIPAFIGHTAHHATVPGAGAVKIAKISSFLEFHRIFGGPAGDVVLTDASPYAAFAVPQFRMFYSLQHYFMNGAGTCYIVSVGLSTGSPSKAAVLAGLAALDTYDEPTLYVIPDALSGADYKEVVETAALKCAALGDRMFLADVGTDELNAWLANPALNNLKVREAGLGSNASYCAAYAPHLETSIAPFVSEADIVDKATTPAVPAVPASGNNPAVPAVPAFLNVALYNQIKAAVAALPSIVLPPSPAVAAAYVVNDAKRGVAHAPANMSVIGVVRPVMAFNESQLGELNVDATGGRSINVIRNFTGKGNLIWGARTLDGNSNEWRYVPVRRFYNMVEESLKKATMAYVFESNNANTWQAIKTMTANYLTLQWREGALQGTKPSDAFFVKVGLGETMSAQDILEGRLIVQIGMAVNRPAEFIILQFSHFMVGNA